MNNENSMISDATINIMNKSTPQKRTRLQGVSSVRKNNLGKKGEMAIARLSGDFDASPLPLLDPTEELQSIVLNDDINEKSGWTEQNKWLCVVKQFLTHQPDLLAPYLEEILLKLNTFVRSKRSKLCKNALQLYQLFFDTSSILRPLASCVKICIPLLLERASNMALGSEFINSAANECLEKAIDRVSCSRVLYVCLNDKSVFFEVASKHSRERVGEHIAKAFQRTLRTKPQRITRDIVTQAMRVVCVLCEESLPRSRQLGEQMLEMIIDNINISDVLEITKNPVQYGMKWSEVDIFKRLMRGNEAVREAKQSSPAATMRPSSTTRKSKRKRTPFKTLRPSPKPQTAKKALSNHNNNISNSLTGTPVSNLRRADWHAPATETTHVIPATLDQQPDSPIHIRRLNMDDDDNELVLSEAQFTPLEVEDVSIEPDNITTIHMKPTNSNTPTVGLTESIENTLCRINQSLEGPITRETLLEMGDFLIQAAQSSLAQSEVVLAGHTRTVAPPRYSTLMNGI